VAVGVLVGTSFRTATSVGVGVEVAVDLSVGVEVAVGRLVGIAGAGMVGVGVFASEQPVMKRIVRMARNMPGQSLVLRGDINYILPGQRLDHKCFTRQMPLK
jgi:hypothetical protein